MTISDVAKAAGCSIATVSRVLNGSPQLTEATRTRVLEAAKALGYAPSPAARALAGQGTHTLGLLLPDITNPFFPALARGVEDSAHAHGYTLLLGNTDGNPDTLRRYLQTFIRYRVDGLIGVGWSDATRERIWPKHTPADALPMVLLDRGDASWKGDVVTANHQAGSKAAVEHLLHAGYRRIAMIEGPASASISSLRLAGYLAALAEAGLEPDPRLRTVGDFTFASGQEAMQRFLALPPSERPDALFAANDLMALGALGVVQRTGLKVPEEFGICGFDDVLLSAMTLPGLTTIAQPTYQLGVKAVDLLVERLRGYSGPPRYVTLPVKLVLRETTRRAT